MTENDDQGAYGGDPPRPPQPPSTVRRATLHRMQAIGVPLLVLIPVLALFGVFGTSSGFQRAQDDDLAVTVAYPERFRYKTVQPLTIEVRNGGDARLVGARVSIDAEYLDHFSTSALTPPPISVTDDRYVFALGDIAPGEALVVTGRVQADDYWGVQGRVAVVTDGAAVEVNLATWVFP